MADRFPLIIDSVDQQIQELSSGDNLDLASSGVVNANLVHSSGVNVGVVTATKFKGDGSELENLPASGGTFEATATGTLSDGSKVIVNTDGTVSVVTQTETTGPGTGPATLFANHNTDYITGVFDSNSNRVVLFYRINDANPGKGAALVGEISGGSVTFGSPVDIDTVECTTIDAAFDSTNNKVVVGYRRYASDGTKYHHARVGTVDPSNNSIEFGAAEPINTNGESSYFEMIFDSSSGKIIVAYSDESNNFNGTVKVGTVTVGASPSNDTISFGSANVYYSAGQSTTKCLAADTSNNRIVLVSHGGSGGHILEVRVGQISGTSITFGSSLQIYSGLSSAAAAAFDPSTNKVVVFYMASNSDPNPYRQYGLVGTVDPNDNSIEFGSVQTVVSKGGTVPNKVVYDSDAQKLLVVYQNSNNSNLDEYFYVTVNSSNDTLSYSSSTVIGTTNNGYEGVIYDSNANQSLIYYQDYSNSRYGTYQLVGLSGFPAPQLGSPTLFESGSTENIATAYDSTNNRVVIAYRDVSNSHYGTAVVGTVSPATPDAFPNNGRTWSDATPTNFLASTFPNAFDDDATSYAETTATGDIGSITFDPPLPISSITTFKVSASSNGSNSQNWGFNGGSMTSRVCNGITDLSDLLPSSGNLTSFEVQKTGSGVAVINEIEINGERLVDKKGGPSITFGTPVVFNSGTTVYTVAEYDPINSLVIVAYTDYGNSDYGTVIIGDVDPEDNSIEFGAESYFNTAATHDIGLAYDSTKNKFIIAYDDASNYGWGKAQVGTVNTSNNTMTFGGAITFSGVGDNANDYMDVAYDSTNDRVVIIYRDHSNSYAATAIVGTVNSDDTISFGTKNAFAGTPQMQFKITYDSSSSKVVTYGDKKLYVGTVNASNNTIAFGSVVNLPSSSDAGRGDITYDSDAQKVIISYRDYGNSNYGTIITGSVSGTSIALDSPIVFETAETNDASQVYDSSSRKTVVAYRDGGNSNYGTAVVFSPRTISNNLTAENFIGISDGAYSDGQTATIQIAGAVDDAQSGLTPGQQYYVQNDGTLSETADNPSVLAGTAVAATKLIIG